MSWGGAGGGGEKVKSGSVRQPLVKSLTELRWKRKSDDTITARLGMTRRGRNTARSMTAALSLRRERASR